LKRICWTATQCKSQRCIAGGGQARHIRLGYGTIILSRHTTGEMLDFK
jgi:hypothetical protein